MKPPEHIAPAQGKLAVFLPGLGAVATTFIAGCLLAQKNEAKPIGSLTQMGAIRIGDRAERHEPKIFDFVPLAALHDLEFCAWDIFADNAYEVAVKAGVLESHHLAALKDELERIVPKPAVFYPEYVKRISGTHVKKAATKADMVDALRGDIRSFMDSRGCLRAVAVWCGSTEIYLEAGAVHQSIEAFEAGLRENDPSISNSQIYAWACLKEGVPFANGAPTCALTFPPRTTWRMPREHLSAARISRRDRP